MGMGRDGTVPRFLSRSLLSCEILFQSRSSRDRSGVGPASPDMYKLKLYRGKKMEHVIDAWIQDLRDRDRDSDIVPGQPPIPAE